MLSDRATERLVPVPSLCRTSELARPMMIGFKSDEIRRTVSIE